MISISGQIHVVCLVQFIIIYFTLLAQWETFKSLGRKMSYRTSIWSSLVVCSRPAARLAYTL